MYLFELFGTEGDPRYQSLAISNGERQFQFLEAIIDTAISSNHTFLSHAILKERLINGFGFAGTAA